MTLNELIKVLSNYRYEHEGSGAEKIFVNEQPKGVIVERDGFIELI